MYKHTHTHSNKSLLNPFPCFGCFTTSCSLKKEYSKLYSTHIHTRKSVESGRWMVVLVGLDSPKTDTHKSMNAHECINVSKGKDYDD